MNRLSELWKTNETYIREEPPRREPPRSDWMAQLESMQDKNKRTEVIKAWTSLSDHPKATDLSSAVGSAFEEGEFDDDELAAVYEVIGEGGMLYSAFEHSFWIRHKGKLIRVM